MTIPFYLITPERIVFQERVVSATLPTPDGEITVLPQHIPLITAVSSGVVKLRAENGDEHILAIHDGVAKVDAMGVTVLAASAERADELIMEQVEKALSDAKNLAQERQSSEADMVQALALVQRETARLHAIRRHHGRRGMSVGGGSRGESGGAA